MVKTFMTLKSRCVCHNNLSTYLENCRHKIEGEDGLIFISINLLFTNSVAFYTVLCHFPSDDMAPHDIQMFFCLALMCGKDKI